MPVEFKTERVEGVHVIHCPQSLEAADMPQIEAAAKSWLLDDSELHVIDFSLTHTFSPQVYRAFIVFSQQLKANSKRLFSMGLSASLIERLKSEGLIQVFTPVENLQDAKRKVASGKQKPTVNVELINPFITATQQVLEAQASTPTTAGKPYLKKADQRLHVDIAGHIALHAKDFNGSVTLCFPAPVFLAVYENMLGEKHSEISAEVQDAAGELLNIIFGQAKTILNDQKGHTLEKALPTILVGDRLRIHHQISSTVIVLPFDSKAGSFHVEISLNRVS